MPAPAPRDGYAANAAKKHWRHAPYQFSDATAFNRSKRDRVVACLESSEGLEVRHALRLGYAPGNIHAFNYDAAVLAHLTRGLDRDRLPRVRTHARSIADVGDVVGLVDVLSLDFHGMLTIARVREINSAAHSVIGGGVAVVNLLAAREREMDFVYDRRKGYDLWTKPTVLANPRDPRWYAVGDIARIKVIVAALCSTAIEFRDSDPDLMWGECARVPVAWRHGRYFSGPLPYLWVALQIGNATSPPHATCAKRIEHTRAIAARYPSDRRDDPATLAWVYAALITTLYPFMCSCDADDSLRFLRAITGDDATTLDRCASTMTRIRQESNVGYSGH